MLTNLVGRFSGSTRQISEQPPEHFNDINGRKQLKFLYEPNPLDTSNNLSFMFLHCLNPLFSLGTKMPLSMEDIWPPRNADRTQKVSQIFENEWKNEQFFAKIKENKYGKGHKNAQPSLVTALLKGFGRRLVYSGLCEISYYCFATTVPFLIKALYNYIQQINEDPKFANLSIGWWCCIGLAGAIFCQSISVNSKFLNTYIIGGQMRSALMTAIFAKSLRLSSTAKGTSTSGELVNLMSNDCSRVFEAVMFVNSIWIAPIVIIVAMALLLREIGVSAVAAIALMMLIIPAQIVFGRYISNNRKRMLKFTDERVKWMSEILSGIRIVKLYGQFSDLLTG